MRDNKAGFLYFILGVSSINFAIAGSGNTMSSFAPFILENVEMNRHFEKIILEGTSAKEAYNQDDTNSKKAEEWLTTGNVKYLHKSYDASIESFNKAIELDPNLAEAYHSLGIVYRESKQDYDKAIEYYRKAINLKPNDADVYVSLGDAYKDGKRDYAKAMECYKEAVKHYKETIKSNPDLRKQYNELEQAYKELAHKRDIILITIFVTGIAIVVFAMVILLIRSRNSKKTK